MSGVQEWARIFRINIVYQQAYQDGKKELPGLLAEVKSKDANGLILSAYPPDCYELLRLLQKEAYRPTVLAMPIVPVHPDFHKRTGDLANHVFGPSQWEPDARIPFPGTRRFVEGFKKFTGHMPSFHAGSAYAACQLYEQAIAHTQSLDNEKLRDYIASLDTVTVIGRFKVDHTGKQVGHNSIIIQWQNGKKEIVWPQKMQTAQPLY
jgi:branched-chain amino acid transport system substrate-binding protein